MYKATQTRIQTYLNDVAGVRIVCAFIDDNRLDEQIRQAVLSLETKWTEKEIGFQVELEEVFSALSDSGNYMELLCKEKSSNECREVTEKYRTGRSAYLWLGQLFMRLFAGLL